MTKTRRRESRLRLRVAVASLAAVAGIALLALPAAAPAAEATQCGGKLEINNEIPGIDPPGGLSYKFDCNATVQGFALFSNRQVDYFSTEVLVLDYTTQEATSEQFSCEGSFPGTGFGCRGLSSYGNFIAGEFAISRDPCEQAEAKSDRFKVWAAATVFQLDSVTGKPFTAVTHPFRLRGPVCEAQQTRKEKGR